MTDNRTLLGLHRAGYRVEAGDDGALSVSVRDAAGLPYAGPLVVWTPAVDDDVPGRASRNRQLLEAVCRFRNTGGTSGELIRMVQLFLEASAHAEAPLPDHSLGDGLIYLFGTDDGEREHFFRLSDGRVLRSVEQQFSEFTSLEHDGEEADGEGGEEYQLLPGPGLSSA